MHKSLVFIFITLFAFFITSCSSDNGVTGQNNKSSQNDSKGRAEAVKDNARLGEGMYKVGPEIPAGEYMLVANGNAYYEITKDSTGNMDSIVQNDNFSVNRYIVISDGQYLKFTGCKLFDLDNVPEIENKEMYKIGVDLQPGEYKIHSDGDGYFEVSSNIASSLNGIATNDLFNGDRYITVSAGQYLKMTNASLVK